MSDASLRYGKTDPLVDGFSDCWNAFNSVSEFWSTAYITVHLENNVTGVINYWTQWASLFWSVYKIKFLMFVVVFCRCWWITTNDMGWNWGDTFSSWWRWHTSSNHAAGTFISDTRTSKERKTGVGISREGRRTTQGQEDESHRSSTETTGNVSRRSLCNWLRPLENLNYMLEASMPSWGYYNGCFNKWHHTL